MMDYKQCVELIRRKNTPSRREGEAVNVYVAIIEDRHSDTEVRVFSSPDTAIEFAKKTAREYDRHGELDERLTASMQQAGWLYHGCYSCEGDNIRVVPAELKP